MCSFALLGGVDEIRRKVPTSEILFPSEVESASKFFIKNPRGRLALLVQERLSNAQLMMILLPLILATHILSGPSYAAQYAKQDAWLSILLSSLTGFWSVLAMTSLALRYPGMTIIEYSTKILGKWIGKLLGVAYTYFLFIFPATVTDEAMSYITLFSNPHTPRMVTIALFLTLCGVAAWLGIETIARSAEVLTPINAVLVLITLLMLIPDMKPELLQPVLGHGYAPIFQGAIIPSGWMGEFVFAGFLLPFLTDAKKARYYTLSAVGTTTVIMMTITLVTTMVLGPLTAKFAFPLNGAIRYVSFGGVVERIDALLLGVWIFGGFIKDAVFLWMFCLCLSQLFGIKQYRALVVPVTLISIVGSLWFFTNAPDMTKFLMYTFPELSFVLDILVPTLLWIIDSLRRWRIKTI